jgi:branched-chain amino acid transport system ATP-binding protein
VTGEQPPVLEVDHLSVHHGQLCAVSDFSLRLGAAETFAIIGANGAGKSTLLRTIAGLHKPTSGTIRIDGTDVTSMRASDRVGAGIALVPEGRRLFPSLSLAENISIGTHRAREGPFTVERVYELFPWMRERRSQRASQLSGGEQQAVAIGRALVANPRALLLDELSLGLAPVVAQRIYALLPELLGAGMTVLLVEQDVTQATRVATRVACLLEGRTTLEGRPGDLTREQIESAYFGLHEEQWGGPDEAAS